MEVILPRTASVSLGPLVDSSNPSPREHHQYQPPSDERRYQSLQVASKPNDILHRYRSCSPCTRRRDGSLVLVQRELESGAFGDSSNPAHGVASSNPSIVAALLLQYGGGGCRTLTLKSHSNRCCSHKASVSPSIRFALTLAAGLYAPTNQCQGLRKSAQRQR